MRICFDLFEMFFEVKKSSFSSRFFSQIAPLSSLEKAVDPGVFHSHIFRQTNQNSFLVTLKKITWWSSIVFFGLSVLPHQTCVTHTPSPKEIYPRKYRQIFLPYSCSNGGAWLKDIYPRKYCQIFTNLFFNAYLDTLCLSFPLHWRYMLYNSYPPHKVSWFAIYYKLID